MTTKTKRLTRIPASGHTAARRKRRAGGLVTTLKAYVLGSRDFACAAGKIPTGPGFASKVESMSKDESFLPITAEDIEPGDPITTIWRWCCRNDWEFVPDFNGGEPWIDPRCAWVIVNSQVSYQTARNGILRGLRRVNNLVRLSEAMKLRVNRCDELEVA